MKSLSFHLEDNFLKFLTVESPPLHNEKDNMNSRIDSHEQRCCFKSHNTYLPLSYKLLVATTDLKVNPDHNDNILFTWLLTQ